MNVRETLRSHGITALALGLVCCALGSEPDTALPQLTGSLSLTDGYAAYVPGDSITLTLTGSDDQALRWIGYQLGPSIRTLRDSVRVIGRSATVERTLFVPRDWIGTSPVHVFARDASGRAVHVLLDSVHVIDGRRRPMMSVPLPAAVRDFVFDSARSLLYMSIPAAQQVAVLDLSTQKLRSAIQLFGSPWGLDLTPGGDSLVVALRRTHSLAFVNLGTRAVDTFPLAITSQFNEGPGTLRVMQNRKIILAITFDGTGYEQDGIREFDLDSRTERTRRDAFLSGFGTELVAFVRNSDGTRLVGVLEDACCPARGAVYSAATDTFAAQQPTVDRFFPAVSSDAKGARILIDDVVFDSTLSLLVRLGPQTADSLRNWATVISPDGNHAYIARDRSYKKVRIDGVIEMERVLIPVTPYMMMITPRADLLVAVSSADEGRDVRLWLVDLR